MIMKDHVLGLARVRDRETHGLMAFVGIRGRKKNYVVGVTRPRGLRGCELPAFHQKE